MRGIDKNRNTMLSYGDHQRADQQRNRKQENSRGCTDVTFHHFHASFRAASRSRLAILNSNFKFPDESTSTETRYPSRTSPPRILRAIGVSISRWIARFRGRA